MNINAIRWHMLNGGITAKVGFRSQLSHTYSNGSLSGANTVEQFIVNAPDGSMFLVSITKLKNSDDNE